VLISSPPPTSYLKAFQCSITQEPNGGHTHLHYLCTTRVCNVVEISIPAMTRASSPCPHTCLHMVRVSPMPYSGVDRRPFHNTVCYWRYHSEFCEPRKRQQLLYLTLTYRLSRLAGFSTGCARSWPLQSRIFSSLARKNVVFGWAPRMYSQPRAKDVVFHVSNNAKINPHRPHFPGPRHRTLDVATWRSLPLLPSFDSFHHG
jgi:hypothetical protein